MHFKNFLALFQALQGYTFWGRNDFCLYVSMQKLTLTEPISARHVAYPELRVATLNLSQTEKENSEKHFTKAVVGEPGVNAPVRTYYPNSYRADGPGGSYQGL